MTTNGERPQATFVPDQNDVIAGFDINTGAPSAEANDDNQFFADLERSRSGQPPVEGEATPPAEGEDGQQQPAQTPPAQTQQERIAALNELFGQQGEQGQQPPATPPATPPVAPPEGEAATSHNQVDRERLQRLSTEFQEVLGVDLVTAYDTVTNLQGQVTSFQEAQAELARQRQEIDLALMWGIPTDQVQGRVAELVPYYQGLTPQARVNVDRGGAQAIFNMYQQVYGANAPASQTPPTQQPPALPTGQSANIASQNSNGKPVVNLSEVMAKGDDNEYFRILAQAKRGEVELVNDVGFAR
jgi:hypothetical protein